MGSPLAENAMAVLRLWSRSQRGVSDQTPGCQNDPQQEGNPKGSRPTH